MTAELTILRPDDWHLHVRDGAALRTVVPHSAHQFARAIVMPNLKPPVVTVEQALAYRYRVLAAVPAGVAFEPLMTLYLTDATPPSEMRRAREAGVLAIKLYPAGATTNSAAGVTDLKKVAATLAAAEREGIVLLVHGEVVDPEIDIFDREAVFIDRVLAPLVARLPDLRIVFEHITTADAASFVTGAGPNIAATITPHHLHLSRNALFAGGIRPHLYCLPVLKRERHRVALIAAATSGSAKFFLGTDSAPHAVDAKEAACGCAGVFNAPFAIESYAAAFDAAGAIDRLEGFASRHGPAFYRLAVNPASVTLTRAPTLVPDRVGDLVPFHGGETLAWRVSSSRP